MSDATLQWDDERWGFQIERIEDLRVAFGDDVLRAVTTACVYVNRLTSLAQFMDWNAPGEASAPISHRRNHHAIVWFAIATLNELGRTLRCLRLELAKRGYRDFDKEPWITLEAAPWGRDDYKDFRNDSFKADGDALRAGLNELSGKPFLALAGDSQGAPLTTCFPFADRALERGMVATYPSIEELLARANADHGTLAVATIEAFRVLLIDLGRLERA